MRTAAGLLIAKRSCSQNRAHRRAHSADRGCGCLPQNTGTMRAVRPRSPLWGRFKDGAFGAVPRWLPVPCHCGHPRRCGHPCRVGAVQLCVPCVCVLSGCAGESVATLITANEAPGLCGA